MHNKYRICFDFRWVKLLRFASFPNFCVFTLAVAESQAGEIKPCVSFCKVKLSRMVADLQKPRKFNMHKHTILMDALLHTLTSHFKCSIGIRVGPFTSVVDSSVKYDLFQWIGECEFPFNYVYCANTR